MNLTSHHRNQDLPSAGVLGPRMREYTVILSSGEPTYILAASSEEAAWHALELSEDRDCKLVNVMLTDEW